MLKYFEDYEILKINKTFAIWCTHTHTHACSTLLKRKTFRPKVHNFHLYPFVYAQHSKI